MTTICEQLDLFLADMVHRRRLRPNTIQSAEHRARLDAAISQASQPYRLIITLLRETGMRASEVLSLNIDDVCLDIGAEGLRNGRIRMLCSLGLPNRACLNRLKPSSQP